MPDKKSPMDYIKGKAQTPVERLNEYWHEDLHHRQKFEKIWQRSYNQYISKFEKPKTGFSNFFIDVTRSQARTGAIQTWMNLFGEPPYVEYDPKGQEDITKVRISEALTLDAMNDGHLPEEMWHCILGMFIYGFYTMKHTYERFTKTFKVPIPIMQTTGFDPMTGAPTQEVVDFDYKNGFEQELTTFEGIWYSARSPFRTVLDSAAYNFSPGRMRRVIDTETRMPLERLLELEKQGRIYGVKKNIDKLANGWLDCFQYADLDPAEKDFKNSDAKKDGLVFVRELYDEVNNTKTIVANWDVELYHDYQTSFAGTPLTCFSLYNIPQEVYSMGFPEQLKYVQEYINTEAGLHIDELNLRVHTPLFLRTGAGFRSKIHKIEPGQVYEVAGLPREAAYPLERPSHQAEIWDSINRMRELSQDSTGLARIIEGFVANPTNTATQSSIAANQAMNYISFLTMFMSARMGQMGMHNVMTLHQFMSGKEVRVSLPNELEPQFQYVTPDNMALNISPRLRMKAPSASREGRVQERLGVFDRLAPLGAGQIDQKTMSITPGIISLKELVQGLLKDLNWPGWQRILSAGSENNDPQQQQQMQAMMQMLQQARGNGAFASPDQPSPVPGAQQGGNGLGQIASQANPMSNNRFQLNPNQLLGVQ
jgi:hypothetical protein